jgi:hypothetical protein
MTFLNRWEENWDRGANLPKFVHYHQRIELLCARDRRPEIVILSGGCKAGKTYASQRFWSPHISFVSLAPSAKVSDLYGALWPPSRSHSLMDRREAVLKWLAGGTVNGAKVLILDNVNTYSRKLIQEISYLFDRSQTVSFVLISAQPKQLDDRLRLSAKKIEIADFNPDEFLLLLNQFSQLFPEDIRLKSVLENIAANPFKFGQVEGACWYTDEEDEFEFAIPPTIEEFNTIAFRVLFNADQSESTQLHLLADFLPELYRSN